jgi:hypothetical protein
MNHEARRGRWGTVAAVLVLGAAALAAWVDLRGHPAQPLQERPGSGAAVWSAVPRAAAGARPTSAALARADLPPPDVPAQEWQKVSAALSGTPQGREQQPRVGQFLGFQHRVQRWEALRQSSVMSAQRLALAQALMDEVPTHLSRAELTGPEALALESQLAQDIVPDPNARVAYLQTQMRALQAAQPAADAQDQARLAAYKAQESVITARWLALPPAQRDAQQLTAQLDAVRAKVFDQPPTSAAP